MGNDSHLGERGQLLEVAVVDSSYFEHVVRAHDDAIPFPFTLSVIDDRSPCAFVAVAPLPGAAGVLGRPALLGQCQLLRFR
jgi:hypothetical protein